jgi:hypothetical protein
MPNLEKKVEHKEKLYDLLKTSFSKDFNQSPEYQWGISPTYLQRRNAYKMR